MSLHRGQVFLGMINLLGMVRIMVVKHDESVRLESMAIFEIQMPRINVTPITLASRMVKVFGTRRSSQFLLAAIPTFAQNPAGSRATAASAVA